MNKARWPRRRAQRSRNCAGISSASASMWECRSDSGCCGP